MRPPILALTLASTLALTLASTLVLAGEVASPAAGAASSNASLAALSPRSRLLEDITLFITSFHANYPFSAKAHRDLGRCSRRTAPFGY